MRDSQTEALVYPQEFMSIEQIGSVLCVAPHPDDEVFGAGGLLALLAGQGGRAEVLILSKGEKAAGEASQEMATGRVEESRRAAGVLGLEEPRILDWPDRGMRYGEPLIAAIASAIEASRPEVLLLPSLSEPHPDHQAVALAGIAAAQRGDCVRTVLFYEVGAPMHPNALVDISSVAERKWQAMRQFTSQEAIQPYESQARALATLRAFGRGPACIAAEAFFRVETSVLRQEGAGAALPSWPLARARQQLATTPEQLPLVSVLVRSMDRPQLNDAIACVAAQTYPHLEVVVINASGHAHGPVLYPPQRMALRLVQPGLDAGGASEPCDRARAANLALQAAQGKLALFLDEDDLIYPEHIERLVGALDRQARAVAAYAGVRVEGPDGRFVRDYDLPWSAQRLQAINFLPIHAVLFRLDRVRAADLHLDETLPVLEDWQFWRQLAGLGDFVHCPGVSALYRQTHGHSGIGDPEHPNFWRRWHRVLLERSLAQSPAEDIAALLAWHAIELDQLQGRQESLVAESARRRSADQADIRALQAEGQTLRTEIQTLRSEGQALRAEAQTLGAEAQTLRAEAQTLSAEVQTMTAQRDEAARSRDLLERTVQTMQGSRSWRLTRPLRAVREWLSGRRT